MSAGTMVGCAVGDALGAPFEFMSALQKDLKEWDGSFKPGGRLRKENKAGQYTDDTVATICLAESLIECNGFDVENVANKYLDWYKSGNFRGMGSTTNHALWRLKMGSSWKESGMVGKEFGGNGTAMRVAPIGIFYRDNVEKLIEAAINDATITHNSKEPKMGSVAIAIGTALMINEKEKSSENKLKILDSVIEVIKKLGQSVVLNKLNLAKKLLNEDISPSIALEKIGTGGYVPETVGSSYYCFIKGNSFKESVIMAVKGGKDSDTTAAITGAITGTWYGLDGIPKEYYSVEDFEKLKSLGDKLCRV